MSSDDDDGGSFERPCDGPQPEEQRRGPAGWNTSSESEGEEAEDKENGAAQLVADAAQPMPKSKKMKSWPHTQSLFLTYTADIRALLKAVDDTGCVKQPKAANVKMPRVLARGVKTKDIPNPNR